MDSHPKIGLTGPKILNPNLTLQYSCYRFPSFWQPLFSRTKLGEGKLGKKMNANFLMLDFDHEETQPVDWVMGSAMMIRQAAAAAVGFFDEMFWMYAEDSDLCRRLWEKGYPVYYLHDVVVVHEHRRGSARVPGVLRAVIKNRLTREHLKSWFKYNWTWRGNKKYYERIP
jgi:GT2 family glycosyltransferase